MIVLTLSALGLLEDANSARGAAILSGIILLAWLMPRTGRAPWKALGLVIPILNAWLFFSTFWRLSGQRVGVLPSPRWAKLPAETLHKLKLLLGPNFPRLDSLAKKYKIFNQQVFSGITLEDPEFFAAGSMAFFLGSMGNQLAMNKHPEDAEEAYRLSLQLRPERNAAHVGLATLLAMTGRMQEAGHEARLALAMMDDIAEEMEKTPQDVKESLGWQAETEDETKAMLQEIIKAAEEQKTVW